MKKFLRLLNFHRIALEISRKMVYNTRSKVFRGKKSEIALTICLYSTNYDRQMLHIARTLRGARMSNRAKF